MRGFAVLEKRIDTILNILVVASVGAALFFIFKPAVSESNQPPLKNQYSTATLQPLRDSKLVELHELAVISEPSGSLFSNTSSATTNASTDSSSSQSAESPQQQTQTQVATTSNRGSFLERRIENIVQLDLRNLRIF